MSFIRQSHHSLHGPHHAAQQPHRMPTLRLVLEETSVYVDLSQPSYLVGRHSQADIRLAVPDISRRHCRLLFDEGEWKVVDLNSLNGVFVNENRMHEATLSHGDRLRIGGLTFLVLIDHDETPPKPRTSMQKLQSIAAALPDPNETIQQPRKVS